MKLTMILIILLIPFPLFADSIHAVWEYPETEGLESFLVYDSNSVVVAEFKPAVRENDFDYKLKACTGFYMTAFSPERESKISNIFTVCPKEPLQFETIEILRIIRNDAR